HRSVECLYQSSKIVQPAQCLCQSDTFAYLRLFYYFFPIIMKNMKPLYYLIICIVVSSLSVSAQQAAPVDTTTFLKVEIESEFPGGQAGWVKFLNEHLKYPKKAIKKNIEGTVVVQFIVAKDGTLSDIQAISGPDLLRDAAVEVFKESPHWKPAIQDGKKVKSYKKQPIMFKLVD
ncbi:MAG TPA: energy transducer TonB, partial [Thermoanaerobaculia bacterium]|nr:energy transducer TonB [Thermoanaerobaculia bacterium]